MGVGFRHLWPDEIETAERARSILESGFPCVIDKEGNVSVISGGLELEEGRLHRYSPWGQFYAAAGGLVIGKCFGLERDRSVRLPFVTTHALTTAMLSYGLSGVLSFSPPVVAGVSLLWGLQTERLLHNRSARYHAFLDFFVVLGLIGLGRWRLHKRWGVGLICVSVFLLPHFHTLTGTFFAAALMVDLFFLKDKSWRSFIITSVVFFASLVLLLLLTRPWAHLALGPLEPMSFSSCIKMFKRMAYAFYFLIGSVVFVAARGHIKLGGALLVRFAALVVMGVILTVSPLTQYRYFLTLPFYCLLWPLAYGVDFSSSFKKWGLPILLIVFVLLPEFTTRRFEPFQGLAISWTDRKQELRGKSQPLDEAIEMIKRDGRKNEAVLFDYVPAMVNWYLPGFKPALMPDAATKIPINKNNPVWQSPMAMPQWHVWYPTLWTGVVGFGDKSDYRAHHVDLGNGTYQLTSQRLNQTISMCVVKQWSTDIWNNAPFMSYGIEAFRPEGKREHLMVLAKRCD